MLVFSILILLSFVKENWIYAQFCCFFFFSLVSSSFFVDLCKSFYIRRQNSSDLSKANALYRGNIVSDGCVCVRVCDETFYENQLNDVANSGAHRLKVV